MIVTCPACSSRYKLEDTRLGGQGGKITCPSCGHLYVVRQPQVDSVTVKDSWLGDESAEDPAALVTNPGDGHVELETYDFSTRGVILRVRQGLIDQEFHTFAEVKEALRDGSVDYSDELSTNGILWLAITDTATLETRLTGLRARLDAGEVIAQRTKSPLVIGDDEGDEDAPTMIVRASSLNLDFDPDEEDEPPPPAAALFDQQAEDPETEAVDAPPESAQSAAPPVTPTLKAQEPEKRSMIPMVLLVLVVLAVIALILYRQGAFAGLQG
ncbi:MAG: putative Zn finger-like uncharacterized protein [Myxococcota bacterium]|jgi:predicted Zn finger-like uncharacterized protein